MRTLNLAPKDLEVIVRLDDEYIVMTVGELIELFEEDNLKEGVSGAALLKDTVTEEKVEEKVIVKKDSWGHECPPNNNPMTFCACKLTKNR